MNEADRRTLNRELALFGAAYRYQMPDGTYTFLDPAKLTVYRKDTTMEVVQESAQAKHPRLKRFIRYMLDPVRLVIGFVVAIIFCQLFNHQETLNGFWEWFGAWYAGAAVAFFLHRAREWAGAPKRGD